MKICPEHNVPFSDKSPNRYGQYYHVINYDRQEYCNKSKNFYDNLPWGTVTPKESAPAVKVDSEARGKTRCQIICAVIGREGLSLALDSLPQIELAVDYVMNGISEKR